MVNVEENYRQIGRSMQDNLRKINGQQTEYSVGIVGIGDIGSATAQIIPSIERVESLRLFTRDPDEKGRFILNNLVGKRPIDSSVSHSDTLEEMVHDLDILVIAIGKDNVEYRTKTPNITRDSVFELNKIPLIGTSERIKGFEKSVIVVTNPVEKAAQIVAEYSKIDPGLITGLSHTDLVRLRRDFRNYFASKGLEKKYLEGIRTDLVGTHSENAVGFFGLGG